MNWLIAPKEIAALLSDHEKLSRLASAESGDEKNYRVDTEVGDDIYSAQGPHHALWKHVQLMGLHSTGVIGVRAHGKG